MRTKRQTVGLLCCKGALPAHSQLEVHQNPMVLGCFPAFLGTYCCLGLFHPRNRILHFLVRFLHEIPLYSILQPVEVHLNGPQLSPQPSGVSAIPHSLYLLQTCWECTLSWVNNEDPKQYLPQYWLLGYTFSDLPPTGLCCWWWPLLSSWWGTGTNSLFVLNHLRAVVSSTFWSHFKLRNSNILVYFSHFEQRNSRPLAYFTPFI